MSLESDGKESKRVVESVDVDDCTVFHEPLANNDDERTLVKLRCRHQFHLDCIGSAYNRKNRMECPNCRQIEKGKWMFAKGVDEQEGADIRLLPDMPTRVWSDSVLPSVQSHIDGILLTNPPISAPYAPNQITDNGYTRFNIWRDDPSLETRMQRQIAEHVALIADTERRLHDMMYEYHGSSGGTSNGGESSGGGGGEKAVGKRQKGRKRRKSKQRKMVVTKAEVVART